ncbi:MAG: UDP-N-acetylglucosamine 2-epimerase (non-hydrolyzing) [bacterium]|jgi:UDP-GlcNAc3NAcA epimerase
MIKILTIIGARPQIIKAAALSRAIRNHFSDKILEVIVHTGQHYDEKMSQIFIDQLGLPAPDYNLNIGSASHGRQTGRMIESIEEVLQEENPDYVVIYGDTNSTLAGSVAASKLHIPVVHIEAGLRSFNKSMPEEINRIVCDHLSTLLFSPTQTGYDNLIREGFSINQDRPFTPDNPGIYHCGDVMYDNSIFFKEMAGKQSQILEEQGLTRAPFILGTIHRDNNTDQPGRLKAIFSSLAYISDKHDIPVVLPLHPRTSKALEKSPELAAKLKNTPGLRILPPVSFLDMVMLESNCKLVMTDSGGVQKEAYFFEKPCIILRSETEWTEIVDAGAGIITDADPERIKNAFLHFTTTGLKLNFPQIFGDGKAAEFICRQLLENR